MIDDNGRMFSCFDEVRPASSPPSTSNLLHTFLSAPQKSHLQLAPSPLNCGFSLSSLPSLPRRPAFRHWTPAHGCSCFIENHGILSVVAYTGCPHRPSQAQGFDSVFKRLGDIKRKIRCMFPVLVLDRYLLGEMALPFLAALAIGSILGMSIGAFVSLARQVVTSGLPLRVALVASFLQMPRFLYQTMPAACMAAVLFSLNRLQGDMELLAMLATGVPIWCLMRAPIYLGLLGAVLQLACTEYAVPFADERVVNMTQSFLTTDKHGLHQRDDVIYPEYDKSGGSQKMQRVWYAKRFEGDLMTGVLMLDFSESGQVKRVLLADECEHVPNQHLWKFMNSTIIDINVDSVKHRMVQIGIISMLTVGQIESRSPAYSPPFVASIICATIYNFMVTLAAVAGHRKLISPIMSAWLSCLVALLVVLCCLTWKIFEGATFAEVQKCK